MTLAGAARPASDGIRAVAQRRIGESELIRLPDPRDPGEGEVRVRMALCPIGTAEVRAVQGSRIVLSGQSIG